MVSCSGCNYDESYVEDNINADDDDDDDDDDRWQWMDTTKMDKSYNNQTDKLILMKMAKSYNQKLTKFVLIWSGLLLHSEAVHNLLSGLFASTFASKAVSSTDNKRQQYSDKNFHFHSTRPSPIHPAEAWYIGEGRPNHSTREVENVLLE